MSWLWIFVLAHLSLVVGFQYPTTAHLPVNRCTTDRPFPSTLSKVSWRRTSLRASTTILPSDSSSEDDDRKTASMASFPKVLWKFTRPHTIIGSALAIPALHVLAAPTYAAAFSKASLYSMGYAMIPALLMNLYITGLNQVTDVEIDKINKPNLPIAAGDLSMKNAIIVVLVSLLWSLVMGLHPFFGTQGLNVALWMSCILGTLYSLEPFRLKRFPFLAAFCIVSVRGAVINAGFFAHAKAAAFGARGTTVLGTLLSDKRCLLSSLYFAIFGLVIALMKDVPDVKGDEVANVRTFSVRLGPQRVFRWMHRLLSALFVGVGVSFFQGSLAPSDPTTSAAIVVGRSVVGAAALLAGYSVQKEAVPVNPQDPKEVYNYYMHLWKLFYLSYFVLPLAR